MAGANFGVGDEYSTVTETDFKTWNELLNTNISTTQQILDKVFSGSFGIGDSYNGPNNYTSEPAIDNSGFQNYVHFSSAKERVVNFKYKLQLLEYYDSEIVKLETALGDDTGSLQGNVDKNRRGRSQVIGGFDGFERWHIINRRQVYLLILMNMINQA